MKKVLTLVSVLFITATFAAAQRVQQGVEQVMREAEQTASSNAGAEKRNEVLDLTLVETVVHAGNGAQNTYHAAYRCKVYPLDQNWYIAAGTCGNSVKGDVHHDDASEYTRHELKLTQVDGSNLEYKKNERVTLIRTSALSGPYVNVLASTPVNLLALTGNGHTLKVNTSRFGLNAVRSREIRPKSIKENVFSLREGRFDLSGSATDPLFVINPNNDVFVAAYNKAPMRYFFYDTGDLIRAFPEAHGDYSNSWFSLTEDDLKFIKQTVSAYEGDWDRIKTRLFLDQTQTPYEK